MSLLATAAICFASCQSQVQLEYPMAFFTDGTKIVYSFDDHRSKDVIYSNHTLLVKSNYKTNGRCFSTNRMVLYKNDRVEAQWEFRFAYDSTAFYAFTQNWCYPLVKEEGVSDKVQGDTLNYPLAMKTGDTLSDAWGSKKQDWHGSVSVTNYKITHRVVEKLDTLKLPFGEITAFRIVCDVERSWAYANGNNTVEHEHSTEWFSPRYGLVKWRHDFAGGSYTETTMQHPGL